jgi:hypothetical protein
MGDESKKRTWTDPELVLDQWYKYEQVAMHFNDLLMRFRTQALGGLAAVGTLAAVLVGAKGIAASYLPWFFGVLTGLWVAAWALDAGYYSLLLKGAVSAIKAFEASTTFEGEQRIGLSTAIDKVTTAKWPYRVHFFYATVTASLCLLSGFTWHATRTTPKDGSSVSMPVTFTVDANRANVNASTSPPK